MNSLIVFDIETIPDTDLCYALTGFKGGSIDEKRKAMQDYHLKITDGKNPFLRQPFHKIVVISLLKARLSFLDGYEFLELEKVSSGDIKNYTEKELVKFFFDHVCKSMPRLVSFNGRTFDIPVLKYRAIKNEIEAKNFYSAGDKWNSYNQRYSIDWHTDLLDVLSDFGLSARIKMNEACAAFGLPGKIGMEGCDVAAQYDSGNIEEIKNYCEADVLNTYLIYLKTMLHRGKIKKLEHEKCTKDLACYLENKSLNKPHYKEFLSEWAKSSAKS